MNRIVVLMLLVTVALSLSACGGSGGIMSPRYSSSSYDSHDVTLDTTQTATLEQSHNKALCVGLLVFASCNTTQSNVQTAPSSATRTDAPADAAPKADEIVGFFLVAAGLTFGFCFVLWFLRWLFGVNEY